MSTGPFVTGLAAALIVSASLTLAASDDKTPKGRKGSHEAAASTYSATFPTHGAMCASGSSRASKDTLNNPFASFNGSGAYSSFFFKAGYNAGGARAASAGSGRTASLVSMPSNGRSSSGAGSAAGVKLPGAALSHGIVTALAHGTPAVGASAQSLQALDVATPSATPEPATLLLLTTGIGGVIVARRRRGGAPK